MLCNTWQKSKGHTNFCHIFHFLLNTHLTAFQDTDQPQPIRIIIRVLAPVMFSMLNTCGKSDRHICAFFMRHGSELRHSFTYSVLVCFFVARCYFTVYIEINNTLHTRCFGFWGQWHFFQTAICSGYGVFSIGFFYVTWKPIKNSHNILKKHQ